MIWLTNCSWLKARPCIPGGFQKGIQMRLIHCQFELLINSSQFIPSSFSLPLLIICSRFIPLIAAVPVHAALERVLFSYMLAKFAPPNAGLALYFHTVDDFATSTNWHLKCGNTMESIQLIQTAANVIATAPRLLIMCRQSL